MPENQVQKAQGIVESAASNTVNYGAAPTDGNLLFAMATAHAANVSITGPSGWTEIINQAMNAGGGGRQGCWFKVASSDGTGVTITNSLDSDSILQIAEYSGMTADPFNTSAVALTSGDVVSLAIGPTGATDQGDVLLVGHMGLRGRSDLFDDPWASEALVEQDEGESAGGANNKTSAVWAVLTLSAPGAFSSTVTWNRSEEGAGFLVTFRIESDDLAWHDSTPHGVQHRVAARAY